MRTVSAHAHEGIARPNAIGQLLAGHKTLQGMAQVGDLPVVELGDVIQRGLGLAETLRGN